MTLHTPIGELKGVGTSSVQKFKKLGITTLWGLINHVPERYEDFRHITPISTIKPNTHVCLKGRIRLISSKRSPRRRLGLTECILEDATGSVQCIWLHQPYIAKTLSEGDTIFVAGKVSATKYGIQLINPVHEKITAQPVHTARLVPVYPLTAGLTQRLIRSLLLTAQPLIGAIKDPLPEDIRTQHSLMPLKEAYRVIHFPVTPNHAKQARDRLALQELIDVLQSVAQFKKRITALPAQPFPKCGEHMQQRIQQLPFTLTDDQQSALQDIQQDVQRASPMNRMINGDVGSGKTILAHLLADSIASAGGVTACIAPTQILAHQHFSTFQKFFPNPKYAALLFTQGTHILLENGKTSEITAARAREYCNTGDVRYILGTHTLLQKTVHLQNLSCVVIDEQHRFGVQQRAHLLLEHQQTSQHTPHFLSLTATPIPRSFARLLLGGTDMSVLETQPQKQRNVHTQILSSAQRDIAYNRINNEIKKGCLAFIICPLIEESDTLGVKSVLQEHKLLAPVFPGMNIGILHGKLSATQKEKAMRAFASGETPILVSTTVVEVGIDVPNATVMLIEGAERFGLAQLHQLRGRIGRNGAPSTCFTFTSSNETHERLRFFEQEHNGFALAAHDLELRGPGTILGTLQAGFKPFRFADAQNASLVSQAQKISKLLSGSK